jgi:uncharacterized protein
MIRWRDYLLLLMAFLTVGSLLVAFVRVAMRSWWERRGVRLTGLSLLAVNLTVPSLWFFLMRHGWTEQADRMVSLQLVLFFGQLALGGVLLMTVLWKAGERWRRRTSAVGVRPDRRRFLLQGAALALPAVAGATGLSGVAEASGPVRLVRRKVFLPSLPPRLDGLRILHFADAHLWHLIRLPDLKRALRLAPRGHYDMVCVTGDLVDDMRQLPDALRLIADLEAPLGHYACLGNHEHARGLNRALDAFERGPVHLLRTSARELVHRGQPFVLAGIDDLRAMPRLRQHDFYREQVNGAMQGASSETPSILLSHRPSVLPFAAAAGVDLVLAGHTHGGQLAIAGRSILTLNGSARWAWGLYRYGPSVMHVTCGLGQWFPFRLGCPCELVLLELHAEEA